MIIQLSLKVPGKESTHIPQQSRYGERFSVSRANGLFIYLCRSESPKRSSSSKCEKTVTVHGVPRGRKAYVQWCENCFSKGWLTSLLSLPQCHSAFSTTPSTSALVNQSPVSQRVSKQPYRGCTFHTCYSHPHDPG